MNETYRQSLQADYLPKDLSLIIIHVYKLSSPEDSPARDGEYIMSKQTTLFMWIWTCIYSCSPHTHIFTYKTHSARSVSGDQTFMKTPVRWHYGSITHSWLQLPPDTSGVSSHSCNCLRRPASTSLGGDAGRGFGRHGLARHPGTGRLS